MFQNHGCTIRIAMWNVKEGRNIRMKRRNRKKRFWGIVFFGIIATCLITSLAVGAWLKPYTSVRMDMSLMQIAIPHEPSVLYAYEAHDRPGRTGKLHPISDAVLTDTHPRIFTPYEEIPIHLINAFIAIEDKRFWAHDGVDVFRTAHAGIRYLLGNGSFGGSTITQQLVKNLTGNTDHSVDRKLNEIFCALDLEKQTDKRSILEAYLNVINLAEGCYGVGAAAKQYFSKSISELTLPECATLAAITNNPSRYDPLVHPENNRFRRDLILHEMADQGYISEQEMRMAVEAPISLTPKNTSEVSTVTSWYTDMVVSDVIRDLRERRGYTYATASMLVYQGGLRIETAIDEDLQRIVEEYYARSDHFPTGDKGRPQSSMILLDPTTGDVLAVAGAVGEKRGNRLQNYAIDTRRPAGSCIKPVTVYGPAVEKGLITWADIYEDTPLAVHSGNPWPSNADGRYRGRVTVKQAIAHSLNPVAVRVLEELGLKESFSYAHDSLGMRSLIPAEGNQDHDLTVASLALGQQSRGVTVREITAAYTAFYEGLYSPPVSYHRVLDRDGNVLLENRKRGEDDRVMSKENAALMTRLLMTVMSEGTAARYITVADSLGIETAGKTGTTQNNCDRWFIGYTPRLLAGVWMGYDYPEEMKGIQGNPCVTIWDDLMNACELGYSIGKGIKTFDVPPELVELEYCPLTGLIPNEYCTDPIYEQSSEHGWFVRGTEPQEFCKEHCEPPVVLHPDDPSDSERIPLLPNDVLPPYASMPSENQSKLPWYVRWFSILPDQKRRSFFPFRS